MSLRDLAMSPEALARSFLPTLFTERASEEMRDGLLQVMTEARPAGTRPMLHALAEADLRDVLPTIAVPTLLLYGAEDARSPLPVAEAMHAAIPDLVARGAPGCRPHEQHRDAGGFQRRGPRVPRRL